MIRVLSSGLSGAGPCLAATALAAALSTATGCYSDPERRAWHGAIEVTSMREGLGACDAELEEVAPPEPYLFIAVSRTGLDDAATLYWCPEPRDCGVPYETGLLLEITETRLEASNTLGEFSMGFCNARWNEFVATQRGGDRVSLALRVGSDSFSAGTAPECGEYAFDLLGGACDKVIEIEGRR